MFRKLWRTYVTQPRYLRRCADYGFVPDPALDALCTRFDTSLMNTWYAKADQACSHLNDPLSPEPAELQTKVDDLVAEQKTIQAEGGEALRKYLEPYFAIVERSKSGEWGKDNPPTIPGGWARYRTARNWRD